LRTSDQSSDVHSCAEQFENDSGPTSTIIKSLKRATAGEYSCELSAEGGTPDGHYSGANRSRTCPLQHLAHSQRRRVAPGFGPEPAAPDEQRMVTRHGGVGEGAVVGGATG
jgi:hypothetical protein